jgi:hypothetical protein
MPSRKRFDAVAPCCRRPSVDPSDETLPNGRRVMRFAPGTMGGEMRIYRDQTTGELHFIECGRVGGDDGSQTRPFPVETFLSPVHLAAFLGMKLSTIYAWAPFLESADKIGARLIFWTEDLMNIDLPELENRLPSREDLLADRKAKALDGEVLRRGPHIAGCLKTHEGPCVRPIRPTDPRRSSRLIRRGLGKNK